MSITIAWKTFDIEDSIVKERIHQFNFNDRNLPAVEQALKEFGCVSVEFENKTEIVFTHQITRLYERKRLNE